MLCKKLTDKTTQTNRQTNMQTSKLTHIINQKVLKTGIASGSNPTHVYIPKGESHSWKWCHPTEGA